MRTRRCGLVLTLLLIPAAARADRHDVEASAAASAATGSTLWGGTLSLARTIRIRDSHKLSVFADYSKYGGSHDGVSLTETSSFLGVRRVMIRTLKRYPLLPPGVPPVAPEYRYRIQVYLHAAPGLVKTSEQGTNGALLGGAGLDGLFSDYGGVRGQVDYVKFWPESGRDHFFRFSLGVIYRFEHEHPTAKAPKAPKAP